MQNSIVGQVLLNQYRVDAFIASGGMGAVFRVWDLKRNVPLAMKVLHADLAEDPSIFKRFQREANALKKLTHPNIVPFYGLHHTQDFTFILEAYVDGPTLKDVLRARNGKPLPVSEALTYLRALSAALGYAHVHGVVHCDVKPGNVIIDRGGQIYLTDFGIARHAESTTTTLGAAGTPAYMAPEQIRGEAVSPATDVYALGVLLFEMLTGQRPFRGDEKGTESAGATANERTRYAHLHLPPPDARLLNLSIPEGLAQVIQKALAKDHQARYSDIITFYKAVLQATTISPEQVQDRVQQVLNSSTAQHQVASTFTSGQGSSASIPRKRGINVILGGTGLLILFGVILLVRGFPLPQPNSGGRIGTESMSQSVKNPVNEAIALPQLQNSAPETSPPITITPAYTNAPEKPTTPPHLQELSARQSHTASGLFMPMTKISTIAIYTR